MNWRETQKDAFSELVASGVYSVEFEHAPIAREFVPKVIEHAAAPIQRDGRDLSVIDCGCGTAVWLDHVADTIESLGSSAARCYGFDLTPEMVPVARRRMADRVPETNLQEGDVLVDRAYEFEDGTDRFDIVYGFDVIQQLPRPDQLRGCLTMLRHVAPGGTLVIFDHERRSMRGIKMAARKWITRNLSIPLVPEYYLNARYPPLARFARAIRASGPYSVEILVAPQRQKRALVVRADGPR